MEMLQLKYILVICTLMSCANSPTAQGSTVKALEFKVPINDININALSFDNDLKAIYYLNDSLNCIDVYDSYSGVHIRKFSLPPKYLKIHYCCNLQIFIDQLIIFSFSVVDKKYSMLTIKLNSLESKEVELTTYCKGCFDFDIMHQCSTQFVGLEPKNQLCYVIEGNKVNFYDALIAIDRVSQPFVKSYIGDSLNIIFQDSIKKSLRRIFDNEKIATDVIYFSFNDKIYALNNNREQTILYIENNSDFLEIWNFKNTIPTKVKFMKTGICLISKNSIKVIKLAP